MQPSTTSIQLLSLLEGVTYHILCSHPSKALSDLHVEGITTDSRQVTRNFLFVALQGVGSDGHDYIRQAVVNGCTVVLCKAGKLDAVQAKELGAVVIEVEDTALAYGAAAANSFDRPADKMKIFGITGTNGKTTVTYLLEHVLLHCGYSVGVIGTVNNRYTTVDGRTQTLSTRFTTPEAYLLQGVLREMADNGIEIVIMEVSSHALAQARIHTILFDAAAFTNLSRDHLDYHPDMDDYFRAKLLLFTRYLKEGGTAVLPAGDTDADLWNDKMRRLVRDNRIRTMMWGDGAHADIRLDSYVTGLDSTVIEITAGGQPWVVKTPLVGRFNVDNILTTFGLAMTAGMAPDAVAAALASAAGAPGRLERATVADVWPGPGPLVLVDYAHTPDALEKVLSTVKELPHGELFCVFGCGGDRDKGKRPVMGGIAARLADVAVVTDDNPRTEDADQIVAEIRGGVSADGMAVQKTEWLSTRAPKERGCVIIRDRRRAIEAAVRTARQNDIVLIAGKGHEPYQLTLSGKRFFDDRMEAMNVLLSWTPARLAEAVNGVVSSPSGFERLLGPVITDSRITCRDGIFVALRGENHDAHDYVEQAVENGTVCVVVERYVNLPRTDICQILVEDSLKALGDMAAYRRRRLAMRCEQKVIGLTGSCGKTTIKEMTAAILARKYPEGPDFPPGAVLKTKGNFNNLIGLPLSLLPINFSHRAAVMEMGMNRPGELKRLAEIADPDISCISNIHGAHLEGLQSIEGVARAKEELFAGTKETAVLVINLDDPRIVELSGKYRQPQVRFSMKNSGWPVEPDFFADNINLDGHGVITFTLHHRDEVAEVHLYTAGEHNVGNAVNAAAIASVAGAGMDHIVAGLADFRPPDKRMVMMRGPGGCLLIDDTYNANPASMAAGLRTLKQMARKRTCAIIGDMRELGDSAEAAHYAVGRLVAELQLDCTIVIGDFREVVVEAATASGLAEDRICAFAEKSEAAVWFLEMAERNNLGQDDLVLVKASRGLSFETIIAAIQS